MTGTTNLNVSLSPALQNELGTQGVWADAVWFDKTQTTPQWTNLVANGTIVNGGTVDIALPNTVANPTNGGKVYFIIQSGPSLASDPIQSEITLQSDINWNNAGTFDFGYDSFEVSLLGASGDSGNLSSVNAFGLPMEVSVPYTNGTTASVGYAISGGAIVNAIQSIHPTATATYNYTAGPLNGVFRMAPSPLTALDFNLGNAAFSSSDWNGYVSNIQTAVMNGTLPNPIVLSGEFNGAEDAGGIWHNGGYFAYRLGWDGANAAFELVPLPSSQIQGTIEITPAALEANIYQPGIATPGNSATIYSNGSVYSGLGLTNPMNTGANNQWGKVLGDLFTGFTGGFYEQSGTSFNPNVTGTIDLNQNLNWDPKYAFGQNVIAQSATYQTSDPYSQIYYTSSNSYGSAYSDNLMSQYSVGGPLISVFDPMTNADVSGINLTIFANSDTPSPSPLPARQYNPPQNTSQGYTPPEIYNYIPPDHLVAGSTSYAIPNDVATGYNVGLDFAASVKNNAGVVLDSQDTITLSVLTSDTGGIPSWDTITFDGSTAGTLGLWQLWNITGSSGVYTAVATGISKTAGSMVINNFPVVQTGTAISWYQIGVGGKTFNLYTTTIDGKFEDPNYIGQQGTLAIDQRGALAIDGLATITPPEPTQQTQITFNVNFATSSAVTVDPSLFVANPANATPAVWAANQWHVPDAPVVGTLSAGTFTALANQTFEATNTITTSQHDLAFGWTGDNPNALVGTTAWVSGYTNKIDAGDVARVTIGSSGGTIVATGTADIDGQWNTGTVYVGNGVYSVTMQEFLPGDTAFANPLTPTGSALSLNVTCFAAGTRIATERGEVAVEALREGDRVQLVVGSAREIVWIGQRTVDCSRHPRPKQVWPVRIAAGAFGTGRPYRDLLLSPDHAVYVGAVLIPVKYLINDSSIAQVPVDEVSYYHVELPQHAVLLANGLPTESYLDTGDRSNFANGDGPVALYPDFASRVWEADACAPLMVIGPHVDAARHLVAAVARSHGNTALEAAG